MANTIPTTFMNLPNPVPSVDPGADYALNLQSCMTIIDQHNHTAGSGQLLTPASLNITTDLNFAQNSAVSLLTTRYTSQTVAIPNSGVNVGCLYVTGNELYYNDVTGGNQIQITLNGTVNATSSGISSGTNTAAFSSSVLVVKSSSSSGANVQMKSAVLTNSGNLTNKLTLQAPTLSSSFSLTLPAVPGANSFVTLDTSGNFGTTALLGVLDHTNLSASAGIVGTQLSGSANILGTQLSASANIAGNQLSASAGIVGTQLTAGTIGATQLASSINLPGANVQVASHNIVVASTNSGNGLKVIRGYVDSSGSITSGEGFTVNKTGTGTYELDWSVNFADVPALTVTIYNTGSVSYIVRLIALTVSKGTVYIYDLTGTAAADSSFCFIAMGVK